MHWAWPSAYAPGVMHKMFDALHSYPHGHSAISRASSRHSDGKGLLGQSNADPNTVLPRRPGYSGDRSIQAVALDTHRPTGPVVRRQSAVGDHAAASMDGHPPHAADRLASTRARRAAAARDIRSAGTASPMPKYI